MQSIVQAILLVLLCRDMRSCISMQNDHNNALLLVIKSQCSLLNIQAFCLRYSLHVLDNKPIGFLSPQTDVQIKQSEGNLAAQYTSLASQQNSGVQKALDQIRQERVRVMAANLQMDLDLMDQVRCIGKSGGGGPVSNLQIQRRFE